MLVGLGLLVAGFPVLFWNEGNSVKVAKALDEELRGGASAETPAVQPAKANGMDFVADEIRKLAQLKYEGLLTEEEFTAKKKQLLGI